MLDADEKRQLDRLKCLLEGALGKMNEKPDDLYSVFDELETDLHELSTQFHWVRASYQGKAELIQKALMTLEKTIVSGRPETAFDVHRGELHVILAHDAGPVRHHALDFIIRFLEKDISMPVVVIRLHEEVLHWYFQLLAHRADIADSKAHTGDFTDEESQRWSTAARELLESPCDIIHAQPEDFHSLIKVIRQVNTEKQQFKKDGIIFIVDGIDVLPDFEQPYIFSALKQASLIENVGIVTTIYPNYPLNDGRRKVIRETSATHPKMMRNADSVSYFDPSFGDTSIPIRISGNRAGG